MRDRRLPPFVWQSRAAMVELRSHVDGKERTTAVAIYQAMTTLANDARGLSFNATRQEIATLAGCGIRSLDRYADMFEQIGLLHVERSNGAASTYSMSEPDEWGGAQPLHGGGAQPATQGVRSHCRGGAQPLHTSPRLYEEEKEEGRKLQGDERPEQSEQQLQRYEETAQHEEQINTLWDVWCELFGERLRTRELSAARRRTLSKALKATNLEVCCDAVRGLDAWLKAHPDRPQRAQPSRIFETGPHDSSNLTDKIEWWAEQANESLPHGARLPLNLAGVDPVIAGTVRNRRQYVREMYEKPDDEYTQHLGRDAVEWLREAVGHKPIIEDGRVTGWDYV